MAEYIIDKGVSPEVWADIEKLAKALGNMPNVSIGANGSNAQSTSAINAQTEAISKRIKLTMEERVAQQALNQQQKLAATATSQYTSELQKMDAQMKMLSLDLQKMVVAKQTETKAYTDGIAKMKNMSMEYDRMSKASGATMMKTNSMYGSTFQLTQVMRELPNFAISARIGFMSLSNNLPMLIDSFKQLSGEIDPLTGKAFGFSGALKQFGKSLLSLNTIMIVATTLMVLFGDKIIEAFKGKMSIAEKAMESYIKTIKDGSGEFTQATEKFFRLSAIMQSASKGFISQKDAIEEYNKAFGKTNGYVTTFEEAQKRMILQTPNYIKAMGMMAYANAFLSEAVKLYGEAETLRADKTVSAWEKIWQNLTGGFYGYKTLTDAVLAKRENEAKKVDAKLNESIKSYQEAYTKFAKFSQQSGIDIWGDESKPKKGKTPNEKRMQDGKDFIIAQKYFNEEQLRLLSVITKAEEGMQKENETGERNSFERRLKMAESFRNAKNELYDIEYSDSKKAIVEKYSLLNDEMSNDMESNDKLYESGKMSKERYSELTNNYNSAIKISEENFRVEMLELDYKYAKDSEKSELDYSKNKTKIVTDTIDYIQQKESELLNTRLDIQQAFYDVSMALVDAYYQKYNEKLEKESNKQQKIEDEKLAEIEDKENAKVLTKEEAENEKARIAAYYDSVEEEANKKKAELERQQFLISQAFAVADIWIKFAQTMANYAVAESAMDAATIGLGAPAAAAIYNPLRAAALFQASASTALIAAQSIPYFAEGGIMDKNGMAMLGDGGRKELAISPSGKFFISNDTPTMYNLEKGTQILPDVNKLDLMSILALKQVMPNMGSDRGVLNELKNVTKAIQSQKSGNFYGMPLIKQLDNRSRYSSRNKSLMN